MRKLSSSHQITCWSCFLSGMGKIWIEVSLISARGLRRSSSLWKLQWFAVGWIDPNNKYCTKIDASGNANPEWKTKFATLIDDSNLEDLALHVQVHSREPIFLRERLQGTATILLKEFLAKYNTASKISNAAAGTEEEVGSYQLRRRDSNKVQGFIDVSIRLSADSEEPSSAYPGIYGGFSSMDNRDTITLSTEDGPVPTYHPKLPSNLATRPRSQSPSLPHPAMYHPPDPNVSGTDKPIGGPSYHAPGRTPPPPPPPPPSNVGLVPTFLRTPDYMNMPSRDATSGREPRLNAAMGAGAGALTVGAVIFGDDFMSGFNLPIGLRDPNLTVSTDPSF